jgi:hypothetical protein
MAGAVTLFHQFERSPPQLIGAPSAFPPIDARTQCELKRLVNSFTHSSFNAPMSSGIPLASSSNCFTAQTSPNILFNGPMNPDVGGFVVGISSKWRVRSYGEMIVNNYSKDIIINICLCGSHFIMVFICH